MGMCGHVVFKSGKLLHSSPDLVMLLGGSYPSLQKHINIAFNIGTDYKAGLKQGIDLRTGFKLDLT